MLSLFNTTSDRGNAAAPQRGPEAASSLAGNSAPLAELLADVLCSLARHRPHLTPREQVALDEPIALLIAVCEGRHRTEDEDDGDDLGSPILLGKIRQVVRQNMALPDFGPGHLLRLLPVSRSKLYRVLEPSGGVAAFIQRERLQEARRRLTDPRETRSINIIAADVGIPDHSSFSRAFRRAFGTSPSQAREMALGGQRTLMASRAEQ